MSEHIVLVHYREVKEVGLWTLFWLYEHAIDMFFLSVSQYGLLICAYTHS